MDRGKIDTFVLAHLECFRAEDIPPIRRCLEHAGNEKWALLETIRFSNPQTALMLSVFGGPIGIDRLYIGDYLLGVFKTMTCGGIFVWTFVDLFLIKRAAKDNNLQLLMEALGI